MLKTKLNLLIVAENEILHLIRPLSKRYTIFLLGKGYKASSFSRHCKKYFSVDIYNPKALEESILSILQAYDIGLILPLDFPLILALSKINRKGNLPVFPTAPPQKLLKLNNKWKFLSILQENNIPYPKTILIKNENDLRLIPFKKPFLFKLLSEKGGTGIKVIHNNTDIMAYTKKYPFPFIAQEYIEGVDAGISLLARNGKVLTWEAHHNYTPGKYAYLSNEKLLELGTKITQSTKFTGLANYDVRIDRNGNIFFLECNPRVWGSIGGALTAGIDFINIDQTVYKGPFPTNQLYTMPIIELQGIFKNPLRLFRLSLLTRKDLFRIIIDPLPYFLFALRSGYSFKKDNS